MLNEERFEWSIFFKSIGGAGIKKLNYTNKSEVKHLNNFTKKKINWNLGSSGERTPSSLPLKTLILNTIQIKNYLQVNGKDLLLTCKLICERFVLK